MTDVSWSEAIETRLATITLDGFKWFLSAIIGLLTFLGVTYQLAYYRTFGIGDFTSTADLTRVAINAVGLMARPSVSLPLIAVAVVAYAVLLISKARLYRTVLIVAAVLCFIIAVRAGEREASKDARQLLEGNTGRVAWCLPKPNAFDPAMQDVFNRTTAAGKFRLLFEDDGYLFLTS